VGKKSLIVVGVSRLAPFAMVMGISIDKLKQRKENAK
jgi:hypothetical protein